MYFLRDNVNKRYHSCYDLFLKYFKYKKKDILKNKLIPMKGKRTSFVCPFFTPTGTRLLPIYFGAIVNMQQSNIVLSNKYSTITLSGILFA